MKNRCLGVFLIFLAIPLVMASIFELSAMRKLNDANLYKKLLNKTKSYQKTVSLIPKDGNIQADDLFGKLLAEVDEQYLKTGVEKNLDGFFKYVNGKSAKAELAFDIRPLKRSLSTNSEVPKDFLNLLPDDLTLDSYNKFLADTKKMAAEQGISEEELATLNQESAGTKNLEKQAAQSFDGIKKSFYFRQLIGYVVLALTFLILICIAIASRHWYPAIPRWIGAALLIPSVITAFFSFLIPKLTAIYDPIKMLNLPKDWHNLISPIYAELLAVISTSVFKLSIAIVAFSAVLIILSYVLGAIHKAPTDFRKPKEQPAS